MYIAEEKGRKRFMIVNKFLWCTVFSSMVWLKSHKIRMDSKIREQFLLKFLLHRNSRHFSKRNVLSNLTCLPNCYKQTHNTIASKKPQFHSPKLQFSPIFSSLSRLGFGRGEMDSFPSYSGLMRGCFKLCHCVETEPSMDILKIEIRGISKGNQ